MRFQSLKSQLKKEIIEEDRRGTVQDFCNLLNYDNEAEVAAALGALEDEDFVEVVGTSRQYREDGRAIYQGIFVYGPSSEVVADRVVKAIKQEEEHIEKYNLNRNELKNAYPLLRKRISSAVHASRTKRIKPEDTKR